MGEFLASSNAMLLHTLNMSENGITECRVFADALALNHHLTVLNLSENTLGDAGAEVSTTPV